MSRAVQAFQVEAQRASLDRPLVLGADIVKPLRVHLINLNFDEEQENFFLDKLVIDPTTQQCELEFPYVQHLSEFLQGVPK